MAGRFVLCALMFLVLSPISIQLQPQNSGTDANLRGISTVSASIAWASGTKGTVLRTVDSGAHWNNVSVAGAEALDFRDIQAFDDKRAFVLAAGQGEQSRIYKTDDGGRHWQLQFTNQEPKAFYDCFAFWDREHGIALSDSVDGKFLLLTTANGKTWATLHPRTLPAALPNEGAFAASGTCLITSGKRHVWFVTGGPAARVFHSTDRGETWTVINTPILSGGPSQGIFSIAFWDERHGVIVGGDYKDPKAAGKNAAFTTDGGKTWILAEKPPSGYRSAIAVAFGTSSPALVAVGITGIDSSQDGGKTWSSMDAGEYNAVSFSQSIGWTVGPHGRIKRVVITLQK